MFRRGPTLQIAGDAGPALPGNAEFRMLRGAATIAGILLAMCPVLVMGGCGSQVDGSLPSREERMLVRLSAQDREHMRQGMRNYLASVQGIIAALPQNKPAAVSESAKKGGMEMLSGVSASVVVHLPPGFLMLSMDTHQKFDALSRSAAAGDSKAAMLDQLGGILANCTACHAKYRLSAN